MKHRKPCSICGKLCKPQGLKAHENHCKAGGSNATVLVTSSTVDPLTNYTSLLNSVEKARVLLVEERRRLTTQVEQIDAYLNPKPN